MLPPILVSLHETAKKAAEVKGTQEKTLFVELFLAEKSHNHEYEKYKIIKGGITGSVRFRIKIEGAVKF